jgi:outer membrane protein assembly factor BamD (BamD/ComL family)
MKVEQALGNLKVARYYEKRGKLAGAKNYYNEVKDLAPGTENAAIALRKIDELQRQLDAEKASGEQP